MGRDSRRGRDEGEGMMRKGLMENEVKDRKERKRRRAAAAVCSGVSLPLTRVPPLFYD